MAPKSDASIFSSPSPESGNLALLRATQPTRQGQQLGPAASLHFHFHKFTLHLC